jgi:hypothetical protein
METLLLQPETSVPTPSAPCSAVDTATPKMSFFRAPIQTIHPSASIDLEELYQRIVGNRYTAITQQLRQLKDPKDQRIFKARKFDYVTISGVFEKRCEEGLKAHSGLLVVDLDHLEDLPYVKQLLLADNELSTQLLFTSPSGNGLKWVVECELKEWTHAQYFQAVAHYLKHTYGLQADVSGRDVCRACFIPSDPEAVLGDTFRIKNSEFRMEARPP